MSRVNIVVYVGEEDLVSLKAAAHGARRVVEVADGGEQLLEMLSTPSLFGPPPAVLARGIEKLDPRHAERLVDLDGDVVATAAKIPGAKLKKAMGTSLRVVELKTRDRAGVALEQFTARNLRLDGAARRFVSERLSGDLWRARSVAEACCLAEVAAPSERMLAVLAGTAGGEVASWDVTDALCEHRPAHACALAEGIEPVALSTYLAAELLRWAVVAEGDLDADGAQRLVGGAPWQVKRWVQTARRFGPQRLARAAARAAQLDAELRGPIPGELRESAVSLALCDIDAALHL